MAIRALHDLIRTALDEKNWTYRDLSERTRELADENGTVVVPLSSISSIVKENIKIPEYKTLEALGAALDIPLWKLISSLGYVLDIPDHATESTYKMAAMINNAPMVKEIVEYLMTLNIQELVSERDQSRAKRRVREEQQAEQQSRIAKRKQN